jgi:hypothetical protein
LLSRKYWFLEDGAVKVQNGQSEHQSERLEFLDGHNGTIQVRQICIADVKLVSVALAQLNENPNSINTRVEVSHH